MSRKQVDLTFESTKVFFKLLQEKYYHVLTQEVLPGYKDPIYKEMAQSEELKKYKLEGETLRKLLAAKRNLWLDSRK